MLLMKSATPDGQRLAIHDYIVVKCSCKNEHFTLGPTATVNHPDPVDLDRQNRTGLTVNRFIAGDGWLMGDHNGSS